MRPFVRYFENFFTSCIRTVVIEALVEPRQKTSFFFAAGIDGNLGFEGSFGLEGGFGFDAKIDIYKNQH